MIKFSFETPNALTKSLTFLEHLVAEELCDFYFSGTGAAECRWDLLEKAVQKSSRVILHISLQNALDPQVIQKISQIPELYAVAVGLDLPAHWRPLFGNQLTSLELPLIDDFRRSREIAAGKYQVIPGIRLAGDFNALGPSLFELSQLAAPWIYLYPAKPLDQKEETSIKAAFEYLQMRDFPMIDIYFASPHTEEREFKIRTGNIFSGPEDIHLDLSNQCTHSCVFCALYAPEAIKDWIERGKGQLSPQVRDFMKQQLPYEKALEILTSLPLYARSIQFGGAGDPLTHPKALELISLAVKKGLFTEVLTNMDYLTETDLESLAKICGRKPYVLKIIANVSAATSETYKATRPRQDQATFKKVTQNIEKISALSKDLGEKSIQVTMMCVMNRLNFHEAIKYVELAHELGAPTVWFKPLEIHHTLHHQLLPKGEERSLYSKALKLALVRADQLGVEVFDREVTEKLEEYG